MPSARTASAAPRHESSRSCASRRRPGRSLTADLAGSCLALCGSASGGTRTRWLRRQSGHEARAPDGSHGSPWLLPESGDPARPAAVLRRARPRLVPGRCVTGGDARYWPRLQTGTSSRCWCGNLADRTSSFTTGRSGPTSGSFFTGCRSQGHRASPPTSCARPPYSIIAANATRACGSLPGHAEYAPAATRLAMRCGQGQPRNAGGIR